MEGVLWFIAIIVYLYWILSGIERWLKRLEDRIDDIYLIVNRIEENIDFHFDEEE